MQALFLRHGTASHLLEDYRRKLTYDQFCDLLEDWVHASLTPEGVEEIKSGAKKFTNKKYRLFYSPLIRTKQTAKSLVEIAKPITQHELAALSEIFIYPPGFSKKIKISIGVWIFLCIFKSIYTLKIIRYVKEARHIMKVIKKYGDDAIVVSHQARILTIIISCLISPKWRILKIDVRPAGYTIVESDKSYQ